MKDKKEAPVHDIVPGNPDYKPGVTGNKKHEQPVEDVEEKSFDKDKDKNKKDKDKNKQNAGKEEKKIVNEQEQDKIINDSENTKTNKPAQ